MSKDGFVQVPPNSTGGKVDCSSLSVAGQTVVRQRIVIGDNASSANFATVTGGALNVNNGPTAISGTAVVSGSVNIGNTVTVQGTIDKISATVAVSGQVSLGPGTSNIGTINNISAVVAVSGNVTVDKISATATMVIGGFLDPSGQQRNLVDSANLALRVNVVAGAGGGANPVSIAAGTSNIGFINNISATVTVAGNVTATIVGTVPISGTIDKISATATVVVGGFLDPSGQQRNLIDSANLALRVNVVAGSGAGANPVSIAAGTSNIGFINNISATVTVAGSVGINSGTISLSGKLDGISATVTVAGTVSLGAGTANIGTINNISAAVAVTLPANIGTVNNISAAVVLATGTNNIGTINAISASVIVAGQVAANASVTAGNNPVLMGGRVKTSASTTAAAKDAQWLWVDKAGRLIVVNHHPSLVASSTHGPKSVTLSASANTVLVASAGTAAIFVDSILVTSNLAGVTKCDVYTQKNSAAPEVSGYMAIGGGGFTRDYDPPWQISAGQPLVARLKPSASAQVIVCVHFHVGPA